MSRISRGKIE